LGGNDGTGDKSTYYPSYNVCPQNRTPVLVNAVTENGQRALQVMKWGLIPSWHKGDSNSFAYNMSNARLDTLQEKASFRTPLNKGQRCVVLADGFFEWQSTPEGKRPYFVYFKPSKGGNEFEEPYVKKITPRLLTMAGIKIN
jgi:putative SOS response-associated peptidase YedK